MTIRERRRSIPRALPVTGAMTAVTAAVGSLATGRPENSRWFTRLRKPTIQPPSAVFPIVWTALYTDLAVCSAVTVDRLGETDADAARDYIRALAVNLVVNAGWSWVFFRAHRLAAAPVVAAALAASSADLVRRSATVDRAAAVALIPYPLWCTFATVLSAQIWRQNRG